MQFNSKSPACIFRPQANKHKQNFPAFKTDENFLSGFRAEALQWYFHAVGLLKGSLVRKYRIHWVSAIALAMVVLWLGFVAGKPAQSIKMVEEIPGGQAAPLSPGNDFFLDFDLPGGHQTVFVTYDISQVLTEAMTYTRLLQEYDDKKISGKIKSLKYKNLALVATLISATSEADWEQRKWSAMAIEFSRIAGEALDKATNLPAAEREASMNELNTRRLIAMALNYYQGGSVGIADLVSQYQVINKNFLVRKGFCRYKILRAMEQDGIIQLPGFSTGKFI